MGGVSQGDPRALPGPPFAADATARRFWEGYFPSPREALLVIIAGQRICNDGAITVVISLPTLRSKSPK